MIARGRADARGYPQGLVVIGGQVGALCRYPVHAEKKNLREAASVMADSSAVLAVAGGGQPGRQTRHRRN